MKIHLEVCIFSTHIGRSDLSSVANIECTSYKFMDQK